MIILIVLLLCLTLGAVAGMVLLLQLGFPSGSAWFRRIGIFRRVPGKHREVGDADPGEGRLPGASDHRWRGHPVYYAPEQMFDAKPNTAWRCNGNGIGQVISLHASRSGPRSMRSDW